MKPDIEQLSIHTPLRGRIDGLVWMPLYAAKIQEGIQMLSSRRIPFAITISSINQFNELDSVTAGHDLGRVELMNDLIYRLSSISPNVSAERR